MCKMHKDMIQRQKKFFETFKRQFLWILKILGAQKIGGPRLQPTLFLS